MSYKVYATVSGAGNVCISDVGFDLIGIVVNSGAARLYLGFEKRVVAAFAKELLSLCGDYVYESEPIGSDW